MKYMLDTNICIYVINKKPANLLREFEHYPVYDFGISSITHAELQYGVEKSDYKTTNQAALDEFLLPLTILPFQGKRLVACYGEIRTALESKGQKFHRCSRSHDADPRYGPGNGRLKSDRSPGIYIRWNPVSGPSAHAHW